MNFLLVFSIESRDNLLARRFPETVYYRELSDRDYYYYYFIFLFYFILFFFPPVLTP